MSGQLPRRFELLSGTRENLLLCPRCNKRTFRPYFDLVSQEKLERFGRCNREENCGFSAFPWESLKGAGERPFIPPAPKRERVQETFLHGGITVYLDGGSELHEFIAKRFGQEELRRTYERFALGGANLHGKRFAVFWHIDEHHNIHTGKMMHYELREGSGGLRCKRSAERGSVNWVHTAFSFQDQSGAPVRFGQGAGEVVFTQVLFGLPQLQKRPFDKVAIVEGYKTAIVASIYFPDWVWLAADSKDSLSAYDKERLPLLEPLRGREVCFIPDFSEEAAKRWEEVRRKAVAQGIRVSSFPSFDALRKLADKLGQGAGDLEDVLLFFRPEELRKARCDTRETGVSS